MIRYRLFLFFISMMWCFGALAIPADDTPRPFLQPDGTTLTVRLNGDEFYNFHTTLDGYTIVRDAGGAWTYAKLQGGEPVSTGVIAHDVAQRTPAEVAHLTFLQHGVVSASGVARARANRVERDRALNIAMTRDNNSGARRITGVSMDRSKFRGLIILINYNDLSFSAFSNPRSTYQSMTSTVGYSGFSYNNTWYSCQGSMRDYFNYQSNGSFSPQFDVFGPISVNYSKTFIQQNDFDRRNELFSAALTALDSSINYANYDSDNDGIIDMVYFIVAGYTSEYSGNNSDYLWAHAGYLYTKDRTYLTLDNKRFGRYACSGELYGWESDNNPFPLGIGTMCHEFSHVLGLPDIYDTDYSTNGQSLHPGHWDVMASGSGRHDKGRTPVNYSAWERHNLGFATASTISNTTSYTMYAGKYQAYILNSPNSKEYFTLENRQQSGWDTYLPGHGLVVCRVDESVSTPWDGNTVNTNPDRNYYELLRAGGSEAVDANSSTDPFPGTSGITELNSTSGIARLTTWDGKINTRRLTSITETNGVIRFTLATQTAPEDGYLSYELDESGSEAFLRVTGLSTTGKAATSLNLTIPTTAIFNGRSYPVREIKEKALTDCDNITSVNVGSSCRTIGANAFSYCDKLTSVTIASATIGNYAFANNAALATVDLREGVTTINTQAFRNTAITTITVPASVTSLSAYFVDACTKLATINVNSSNTLYSSVDGILYNKAQTTLLRKPCYGGSATYPSTLTAIGPYAYEQCVRMGTITVPYGVVSIGTAAFTECTSLKKLSIPSSVTSIGSNFVRGCTSLTDLYINMATPPTVSDASSYFGDTQLSNLHTPVGKETAYKNAGWTGWSTYNTNHEYAYDLSVNITNTSNVRLSFTSLTSYSYVDANGNKKIADGTVLIQGAGDGVTTINGNISPGMTVTYRNKTYAITRIAPYTFTQTSGTAYTVTGFRAVTQIDEFAFYGCKAISSVNIYGPVESIGQDAFSMMTNCSEVMIQSDNNISPSFRSRLYGGNKSGFLFWINNKYYYSALSYTTSWSSIGGDSSMKNQLRPFLHAEAEVQPFSCYMDYVDLNASGLLPGAYWITGYDLSTKTLKTTRATSGKSNLWSVGMILTGLTPGKIYKLQLGNNNYLSATSYLEHNSRNDTPVTPNYGYHVWDSSSKSFVKPTVTVTVPCCSAILKMPTTDTKNVDRWIIDVLGNAYDVNKDSFVNVADVNAVLNEILNHPDGNGNTTFDVNGDNIVNVADVNAILSFILINR